MVAPARSLASIVEFKFSGLGGYPPMSSKVESPLKVAIWLYTSWREESRFTYMGTACPFDSLTLTVVTYLFLSGWRMKFSQALDFLANLVSLGAVGPERETP